MIVLNYAHPLSSEQIERLEVLLGAPPAVREIVVQIDRERPIAEVAHELADAASLSPLEWQTLPLIVNPPGLSVLALALLAEIHGRSGHFPAIVNIRPVAGAQASQYEVQEIANLQALRDAARTRR